MLSGAMKRLRSRTTTATRLELRIRLRRKQKVKDSSANRASMKGNEVSFKKKMAKFGKEGSSISRMNPSRKKVLSAQGQLDRRKIRITDRLQKRAVLAWTEKREEPTLSGPKSLSGNKGGNRGKLTPSSRADIGSECSTRRE